MKIAKCLTGLVPLLAAGGIGAAQLEEIEILGRQVNLVGSATSASEGLISHHELALRPLLRTGEVLETVPGLVATQHSGSGKANQFFLRGFNLDHGTDFATSVDGMPVNMRTHGHGQGYTDLNFLIPELIEEISFRKGSYYAEVGDFSGTGAAHIRTMAHAEPGQVSLGVGEYGFNRLLLHGGVDALGGELIYGVEKQGYQGPWDTIDEDIDKTNLWLKQRWEGEEQSVSLMLMAYDNRWNSADQIPGRAVESGLISEYGSIDPTVGGESSRYSLSLNWQRPLANGQLDVSAYTIDYEMDLWSNFTYFTSPEGDQFQQVDNRRIHGWNAAWRHDTSMGGVPMRNTLGSQFRLDDIDEVGLLNSRARRVLSPVRTDAVEEWSTGLYWENELQWTPAFRTVAGLRYDYYDFDVRAMAAGDPETLGPNSGGETDDILTGSLSLIYAFNDNYEAYASVGQGFHSNDARGTTIRLDPVSGEAVSTVDPLVDTLGAELGMRAFLTDRLNASIALWHLEIDSELLFVGDDGNTEDTGQASERQGLELTAYYQLHPNLALDLEYAYSDARFVQPVDGADDIPGALEHVFSGGLSTQWNDRLNAYLRLRHFGEYPLEGGATAPGSTLLNLRLGYNLTERFKLTLDVLNLLDSDDHDVEYYYASRLPGESEEVDDHHFHVFEPRSVRAYFNYRF